MQLVMDEVGFCRHIQVGTVNEKKKENTRSDSALRLIIIIICFMIWVKELTADSHIPIDLHELDARKLERTLITHITAQQLQRTKQKNTHTHTPSSVV